MPDDFKSLADAFETDPGLGKVRKVVQQYDIIEYFDKIFPDLVKIAAPVKSEKGILFLRVENSVWRSELRFMEKAIADKVNKFFNEERIKGVKFVP